MIDRTDFDAREMAILARAYRFAVFEIDHVHEADDDVLRTVVNIVKKIGSKRSGENGELPTSDAIAGEAVATYWAQIRQ